MKIVDNMPYITTGDCRLRIITKDLQYEKQFIVSVTKSQETEVNSMKISSVYIIVRVKKN